VCDHSSLINQTANIQNKVFFLPSSKAVSKLEARGDGKANGRNGKRDGSLPLPSPFPKKGFFPVLCRKFCWKRWLDLPHYCTSGLPSLHTGVLNVLLKTVTASTASQASLYSSLGKGLLAYRTPGISIFSEVSSSGPVVMERRRLRRPPLG
jgi:hypothetical protein